MALFFATEHRSAAKTVLFVSETGTSIWDLNRGNRAPVCSENDSPLHPPASIHNFCSTSRPVWLRFSRRSTGLQRKRCVSSPRLGPEFSQRSTGLQRKRCFVSARFGPERKSSFRSKTRVVNANEASRKGSARAAAGSGSGASGYVLFDPTRTLRGDLC